MSSGDLERLVTQLKEAIHDIVEGVATDTTKVYFEDDTRVLRLCFVLEKISHFGLKSGMFSRATVWDYLKNLDKCLPGSQSPLEWVTSSAKTEIGLTRVFFRHALNESALSEYMSALIYNEALTKKFYNKESVFLNDEARGIYLMLLENLNKIKFRLFLKDNALNEFTYWNAYPDVLRRKTGTTAAPASPQREAAPPVTKSVEDFPVAVEPPAVTSPEEKKKRKKKKKTESEQKTIDDLRLIEQAKIDEEREALERKEKIKQEEMRLFELQQKEDQILREKQEKYLKDEQSRLENLKIHQETMFQQTKQLEMDKIQLERDRLQLERDKLEKIQKEKEEQEKREKEEQEKLFKEKERKLKEESEAKLREEKERIEKENLKRLEKEKQEKERLAKEKEEQERKFEEERKKREREEEERKKREEEERERIIKEKLEEERRKIEEDRKAEEERKRKEEEEKKQMQEDIRKQLEIQREIQLAQQEKLKKKQEKLELEKQQREKEERERKQREKEEREEKERKFREREEKERKQREKEEEERKQREKAEKERKEFEKAEKKRKKEEERQKQEKIEAERRMKEEQEKRRLEEEKKRKEEEKRKKEEEKRLKKLAKEEKQIAEQKRLLEEERERIRKQVEQEEREKIRKQMEEERAALLLKMKEEEEERERERVKVEAEKRKQEEERKKRDEEEREKERLEHLRLLEEKRKIEEEKQKLEEEKKKLKEAEEELKRLEHERQEKERQEKERQEREREKEEVERQERERLEEEREIERKEKERQEKERQEKERQEKERREKEREEKERKEREERERKEKEERERQEKERIEKEERERKERKDKKKEEKERKEREEREREERERAEKERKKKEKKEKEERERKEREEKERKEREKAERKEREKKEKIERERKEKEEKERKEKEEKERQEREKAERKAREREEKERKEKEERERAEKEIEEKERERKEKEEKEKKERQERLKQIEEEEVKRKKAESEQRLKQLREEQEKSEQKKNQKESSSEEEESEEESEEEVKRGEIGGVVVAGKGAAGVNNNPAGSTNASQTDIGITEKLGKAASLVSKMFESDNQLGAGEKQKLWKIYETKTERMRNAIHNIVKESVGNVLYADNIHVTELCASVESILFHGILDTKFFGTTSYWDYLENISNCVPNGGDILNKIRKTTEITTDLGRGRCWIRIGLNDNALGQYIKSLLWDKELTNKFYHSHSIMRNEEQIGLILMLLDSLSAIRFSLTLNDERLNFPEGWEILKAEQTANLIRNQSLEQLHSSTSSTNSTGSTGSTGSKKRKTKKRTQKLQETTIENQQEIIIDEAEGSYRNNSFAQKNASVGLSTDYENFKLPEIGNEKYAPISDTLIEDGIINVSESIQYMKQLYKNSNVSLAVIRQNIIKENSKNFFTANPEPGVSSKPNIEVQPITQPQNNNSEIKKEKKLIEPEETFVKIVDVPEANVKNPPKDIVETKTTPVPSPTPVVKEPEHKVLALPEVDLEEPVLRVGGDRRNYFLEITFADKEKSEEEDWYDISLRLKKETEQKNQEKLGSSRTNVPVTTSMSSFTDSGPIPDVVSTTLYKPEAFTQKSCIACGSAFSRTGDRRALYCYYRGKYYCRKCHEKQVSIVPAYAIHNWDFRPYPVSKVSRTHISNTATKAIVEYRNRKSKFVQKSKSKTRPCCSIPATIHFDGRIRPFLQK